MTSPWKFLTRLVSPRRQQRQENGSSDVTPELSAVAKPTETAADDGFDAADRPADEKPVPQGQSKAVSAGPDHSEEAAIGVHGTADIEDAMPLEATDPALSDDVDTAVRHAQKPSPRGEGATRKRRRRGKTAATGESVPPSSPGASTVSDDAIRLDEEIRLLREQLARKLQLQNAQLKKMLERFQR